MARVVFARPVRAQLASLDIRVAEAILDAQTALEGDPTLGKPLRGRLDGLWSFRVGSYRLIYEIRDSGKVVRVVAALHRGISYRSDPR